MAQGPRRVRVNAARVAWVVPRWPGTAIAVLGSSRRGMSRFSEKRRVVFVKPRFVVCAEKEKRLPPVVEARGLVKRFGKVEALTGLDLVAESGQVTALLGPNGAGKTTFVRLVATLLRPDAGELSRRGYRRRGRAAPRAPRDRPGGPVGVG